MQHLFNILKRLIYFRKFNWGYFKKITTYNMLFTTWL